MSLHSVIIFLKSFFIFILMTATLSTHATGRFDHEAWDVLLKKHVKVINRGTASQVDYGGMSVDRIQLKQYLSGLQSVSKREFDKWKKEDQFAFLVNAYNAWTIEFILTEYPNIKSIKELGSFFQSPWKKKFIPLFNQTRSLDDIEHGLIRGSGRYDDPRVHFA